MPFTVPLNFIVMFRSIKLGDVPFPSAGDTPVQESPPKSNYFNNFNSKQVKKGWYLLPTIIPVKKVKMSLTAWHKNATAKIANAAAN